MEGLDSMAWCFFASSLRPLNIFTSADYKILISRVGLSNFIVRQNRLQVRIRFTGGLIMSFSYAFLMSISASSRLYI